jgi:Fe2+ or Zn2+ uptake regulation protein
LKGWSGVGATDRWKTPGKRATNQRRVLLDLIRRADCHLDADELYRRARELGHTISLSTVYRNLKLFRDQGFVQERHFAEEHHHYEVRSVDEHHHLVCLGCGAVTEFTSPLAKRLKREVESVNEFVATDAEIHIRGFCVACQRGRE